jgi:hypothetical protein
MKFNNFGCWRGRSTAVFEMAYSLKDWAVTPTAAKRKFQKKKNDLRLNFFCIATKQKILETKTW